MEDKIFGNAMFGFDKDDVNTYIEKIVKDFENKLREKEEEITLLKIQNKDLKKKNEEVTSKKEYATEDKDKIVEVLVSAQENAQRIVEEAEEKSRIEKVRLEKELNKETQRIFDQLKKDRQKVDDIREQLNSLRKQAKFVIKNFENDIDSVIEEDLKKTEELLGSEPVKKVEISVSSKKSLDSIAQKDFTENNNKDSKLDPSKLIEKIDELNSSEAFVNWNKNK